MAQQTRKTYRRRLKVWQRLFIAVFILALLGLCSTLFHDFSTDRDASLAADGSEAEGDTPEERGWEGDPIYAYVVAAEGELTVPFYNEALAEEGRCGRGAYVRLESWEPFVAESGAEYYHVFLDGK